MGEQHALAYSVWTLGSFAIGVIGYALTAMGILRLSCRRRNKIYWLLVSVAMALSASIWVTGLYVFNEIRAAIFNLAAAGFLALACVQVARDFAIDRLPARYCVLASLSAATLFCILIGHAMIFPTYAAIEPRDAFFLLVICHFSIALFVVVLVQERSEARLRRLANTDALTGIPNRQHFNRLIESRPHDVKPSRRILHSDLVLGTAMVFRYAPSQPKIRCRLWFAAVRRIGMAQCHLPRRFCLQARSSIGNNRLRLGAAQACRSPAGSRV
jgi:hypothetical protein